MLEQDEGHAQVVRADTTVDQRVERDDVRLHRTVALPHDFVNFESLGELAGARIGFDHGGVDDSVALDAEPATRLYFCKGLFRCLDVVVLDASVDEAAEGDVVVRVFVGVVVE